MSNSEHNYPPNEYDQLGQTTDFQCDINCLCKFVDDRSPFDKMYNQKYNPNSQEHFSQQVFHRQFQPIAHPQFWKLRMHNN